jgi:hypothetical protein
MRVVIHLAGPIHALDHTKDRQASTKRIGGIFDPAVGVEH